MTEPDGSEASDRRAGLLAGLAIFLAAMAAMIPSALAAFVLDDDLYIGSNEVIQRANGIFDIWLRPRSVASPYPMIFTGYWLQWRLWGGDPLGYHVVNALLHAANSVLLWRVAKALGAPGALAAGFVFAVHPIHVDSVAQAAELKDVLSGLFYFLALLAWLRFEGAGRKRDHALALGLFLLALLSKTVTCTLPAALLVIGWWKKPEAWRRRALALLPMFAMAAAMAIVTANWEKSRTGASGEGFDLSFAERTLIAGRALWFYVAKLLWPSNLMLIYPKWDPNVRWIGDWLFPVGALWALFLLWRERRRIGRGPLAAALLYAGTLSPALGFINYSTMYYSYAADHYQYLAGAAIIGLACGVMAEGAARLRVHARAAWGAALLALGAVAWGHGATFGSVEAVWRHNARKSPLAPTPHYDLGVALENLGRTDEAWEEFMKAIRLEPRMIEAYLHLAQIEDQRGRPERAERQLNWATRARPLHQKATLARAMAFTKRGELKARGGRMQEAIADYRAAIAALPAYADAHNALGGAFHKLGRLGEAEDEYRQAIALKPRHAQARSNLGLALAAQGKTREAIESYRAALEIDPEMRAAREGLAGLLFNSGDIAGAAREFELALRLAPDSPDLNANLGAALAAMGRLDEAIPRLRRALELRPGDENAKRNLERALAQQGAR